MLRLLIESGCFRETVDLIPVKSGFKCASWLAVLVASRLTRLDLGSLSARRSLAGAEYARSVICEGHVYSLETRRIVKLSTTVYKPVVAVMNTNNPCDLRFCCERTEVIFAAFNSSLRCDVLEHGAAYCDTSRLLNNCQHNS